MFKKFKKTNVRFFQLRFMDIRRKTGLKITKLSLVTRQWDFTKQQVTLNIYIGTAQHNRDKQLQALCLLNVIKK